MNKTVKEDKALLKRHIDYRIVKAARAMVTFMVNNGWEYGAYFNWWEDRSKEFVANILAAAEDVMWAADEKNDE